MICYVAKSELRMQRYGRSKYAQKLGFGGEKVNPDSKYLRSARKSRHGWIRARRSCRGRWSEERRGRPMRRARRSGAPAARRRGRGDRGGGMARRWPEAATTPWGGGRREDPARGRPGDGGGAWRLRAPARGKTAAGRPDAGGGAMGSRGPCAGRAGRGGGGGRLPHGAPRVAAGGGGCDPDVVRPGADTSGGGGISFFFRVGRGEIRDPKTGGYL